jgi:RNA polymerase sigma factor (sigma-70 family)
MMDRALTPAEQRLVAEVGPRLVNRIWRHYLTRYRGLVPRPDLEQNAHLAIAAAAKQYDPSRGPFAVFAWKHAMGAMMDLVQSETRQRAVRRAIQEAACSAQREGSMLDPTAPSARTQLASEVQRAIVSLVLEAATAQENSLESDIVEHERRADVHAALATLDDEAKMILRGHYVDGRTLRDLANVARCSFATIRRRHRRALDDMGEKLGRAEPTHSRDAAGVP